MICFLVNGSVLTLPSRDDRKFRTEVEELVDLGGTNSIPGLLLWVLNFSVSCHNDNFSIKTQRINVQFRLKFGLVKAVNAYLRFKFILCVVRGCLSLNIY